MVCHRGVSPSAGQFAGARAAASAASSARSKRWFQSAVTAWSPSLYVMAVCCWIVECPSTSDTTFSGVLAATWSVASVRRVFAIFGSARIASPYSLSVTAPCTAMVARAKVTSVQRRAHAARNRARSLPVSCCFSFRRCDGMSSRRARCDCGVRWPVLLWTQGSSNRRRSPTSICSWVNVRRAVITRSKLLALGFGYPRARAADGALGEAGRLRQSYDGIPWRSRRGGTVPCPDKFCMLSLHGQSAIHCHYLHGMAMREALSR
jgi:hypothetical protein